MGKATDAVVCRPCKAGKHLANEAGKGGCIQRGCTCHCRRPTVPYRPHPPLTWHHRDLTTVFEVLREHNVISRALPDGRVVYKPKPDILPTAVANLLKEYKWELVVALYPWIDPKPTYRPWWGKGTVAACIGCGRSCCVYDPLAQCRHLHCGYLGQRPYVEVSHKPPTYPSHVRSRG